MKKLCFVLVVFSLLVFVSCGGSSNKDNSTADTDSGDTVTDEDSSDTGSTDTEPDGDVSEPTENPDAGDSDTTSDSDNDSCDSTDDADSSDYADDSDNTDPLNDNPDNLPECSPTSATPCIDSEAENSDSEKTYLIWSGKSPERLRWTDAINYCKNLKEGGYSDWQLPTIAALKTLLTCEFDNFWTYSCSNGANSDGENSKFGDIDFFWSDSQGKGVDFYTGKSPESKSDAENFDVRCVRKEIGSKYANCSELPENAQWNSASSIKQYWQWEDVSWIPKPTSSYDEEAINTACTFTCEENYIWQNSLCLATRQAACSAKPENTVWNDNNADGMFTQIENGSSWQPETYPSGYCTAGVCCYNCASNYYWNNENCVSPCDEKPCEKIQNSKPDNCIAFSLDNYSCDCMDGFYWRGKEIGCIDKRLSIGNICTGQSRSYPFFATGVPSGQDAYYAKLGKCTPQSFTSSSDLVVDNNTGLTWEKSPSTDTYTWDNRATHCNDLNSSNFAGKSNWRVPNPLELLTIVDNSKYDPATNSKFTGMQSGIWTSKEYDNDSGRVFGPKKGSFGLSKKTATLKVLCVSGSEMPKGSFSTQTLSGDVVVNDSTTGFMWQKDTTGKNWGDALKYCEDLTYAGYSDWRLPNKNELASLLNHDKSKSPYSDFPDMQDSFWSSTTDPESYEYEYAWQVDFSWGKPEIFGNKSSGYGVRCVR